MNYYLDFLFYILLGELLIWSFPTATLSYYTANIQLIIMTDKAKQYKQINARIMKWREMLHQGLHSDP